MQVDLLISCMSKIIQFQTLDKVFFWPRNTASGIAWPMLHTGEDFDEIQIY